MTSWVRQSVNSPRTKVRGVPPSALGAVGEARFFELVTVLGKGEFVCYAPRTDFEGSDFLVKRRGREGAIAVQVKLRDYHDARGNLPVSIDRAALPEGDPKLVVIFEYFEGRAQFGPFFWAIPDRVYREETTLSSGKYEVVLSPKPNSRDRFVDYRYNLGDLPWVVGWYVDGRNASPEFRWMAPPRVPEKRGRGATRGSRSPRARGRAARRQP